VASILQELRTNPIVTLKVWADPAAGKKAIISLGQATVPLRKLANAAPQDKQFIDKKTKQRIDYQSRVLFEKAKLQSSLLKGVSNLTVELSMWFQPELPFPEIDLGSIKDSSFDVLPLELSKSLVPKRESDEYSRGDFFRNYKKRLQKNFSFLPQEKSG